MDSSEQNIRNYFKTFTQEDLANSVYLFGIDFDKESLDTIFGYLIALYNEVVILKDMINRDFEQREGEHVLLPKDPKIQTIIIQDYFRKEAALQKALNNEDVYNKLISYLVERRQK